MTENELQILCLGVQIGALLALLGQVLGSVLDDRRDRMVARAIQAQLDAEREKAKA